MTLRRTINSPHHERGVAGLLDTFGAPRPPKPVPPDQGSREKVNRARAPRRGRRHAGAGWAAVPIPPLRVYRAPTHQIGGLYPLLSTPGTPPVGALMGADLLSGGAFYCHPVEWVLRGLVTNPNVMVFGKPGRGKTSTIVALALRLMAVGVRVLVAGDVKGEYTPLVEALGYEPIRFGTGLGRRINPLDLGPVAQRWRNLSRSEGEQVMAEATGRWLAVLEGIVASQGYEMTVTDRAVVADILRDATGIARGATQLAPVTIPVVHRALNDPSTQLVADHRFADRQHFLDHLRPVTDALAGLIQGALAGLFDAETNISMDWDAPIQSMDFSSLFARGDQAIAVALACLGSWSRAAVDTRRAGEIRMVIRDEVWRQMRLGTRMVEAVDSELRLSRLEQIISVLVAHKPSDMLGVGDLGSKAVNIAQGLFALCDTRILHGQDQAVTSELADEMSLIDAEQRLLTGWAHGRPGRAVWKVKTTGHQVQTIQTRAEKAVFDTDAQLRNPSPDRIRARPVEQS